MKEELLHFIWKHKKFPLVNLRSTDNEAVSVLHTGTANTLAGPDFFNAQISINDQLWAGNVEIHLKSSDWYRHNHEKDPNYDNVVLHVVWEDDVPIFRREGSPVPTLQLKEYIPKLLLDNYKDLIQAKDIRFINCESQIKNVDPFLLDHWKERMFLERLERKSAYIRELLKTSNNDWEQVCFLLLLRSFGLNINGDAFADIGNTIDFSIVRKVRADLFQTESLLMGTAGLLLETDTTDEYQSQLESEYQFLRNKFAIPDRNGIKPEFFRLRPANFPTIRLSQLANLLVKNPNLFHNAIQTDTVKGLYELFDVTASSYWDTHYTFGKPTPHGKKRVSKRFVDTIIVNALIPLRFCYANYLGKGDSEALLQIASQLHKEANQISTKFEACGVTVSSAKDSQALLTLYDSYCSQNKCLQCTVGSTLMGEMVTFEQ